MVWGDFMTITHLPTLVLYAIQYVQVQHVCHETEWYIYPLEELEAPQKRLDLAFSQQCLPDDWQVMQVPRVVPGALVQVGGGLPGCDLINRGHHPDTQALEQVSLLTIKLVIRIRHTLLAKTRGMYKNLSFWQWCKNITYKLNNRHIYSTRSWWLTLEFNLCLPTPAVFKNATHRFFKISSH